MQDQMKKTVGVPQGLALVVGMIIGSGVFSSPALCCATPAAR